MTIATSTIENVESEIEGLEDEMLDFLADLIAKKTVTGNEKSGQEVVIEKFESLGLEPDVWEPSIDRLKGHEGFFETSAYEEVGYDGRPNVAARLEGAGSGPTLGLGGHIDVVSVNESHWDTDPWTLTREGDHLYGRGSSDMKGGIAAYVTAVAALQAVGVELEGDLILQSTIEEEAGGVGGVLSSLERGYRPDAAIIPEPFDIPNIGLSSAGVMYFQLSVPGRGAHAATAYEGVDAMEKAILVYEALQDLDEKRKTRIDYPRAYRADPQLKGHETNINIGVVEAGDWPSTVPGEAVLKGRVGWPPGETREEVRNEITGAVNEVAERDGWLSEHRPEISWFGWQAEPHEIAEDSEIATLSKSTAEDVTGQSGQFIGGNAGMDERFYKLYYDIDVATVGPYGENLHGPNERTSLSSLTDTAKTLARIAMAYCGVSSVSK